MIVSGAEKNSRNEFRKGISHKVIASLAVNRSLPTFWTKPRVSYNIHMEKWLFLLSVLSNMSSKRFQKVWGLVNAICTIWKCFREDLLRIQMVSYSHSYDVEPFYSRCFFRKVSSVLLENYNSFAQFHFDSWISLISMLLSVR